MNMKRVSAAGRRTFLKSSLGPLSIPFFSRASAQGREGVAPSRRITLGFIGIGKMNSDHLRFFSQDPEFQILALCDVESLRLERGKQIVVDHYRTRYPDGFKGLSIYEDFRDLLARTDIDAVVIATPDHWHAVTAIAACKAGKDVYCEKPMANSIREGRAMVEAAGRYGRVFQTGSMQRSNQTFRFACELVRNGRIGDVQKVYVNVGGPPEDCYLTAQSCPSTLNWEMWLGPAPWRPYNTELCPMDNWKVFPNWRGYREFGGGGMTDWGAHHFDIAQWGLGMDDSGPVEILPPRFTEEKRLAYRYANGVLMYHGGAMEGAGTEFVGSKGRVAVNRSGFLRCTPDRLRREVFGLGEPRLYESAEHRQNWKQCIKTRRITLCPAEVGHRSVTVCHLGNIAYKLDRPLRWDPVREIFPEDEQANRLLSNPMRFPWTL